jgi:hypothetical protein
MPIKKALLGLLILFSIQSYAETSLLCTGDGRTVYVPYVNHSEDDIIAEFAHNDVRFNVVYDDEEFFVASSSGKFPGKTIYNSYVPYRTMQYRKDKGDIVADSSFTGTNGDADSLDEKTRIFFHINRFKGEFAYMYYVIRSPNHWDSSRPMTSWEEKYGIGTDKLIKIKGTCKVHKLAF